jgi:uncharacterized protein (TIGR03437 family)
MIRIGWLLVVVSSVVSCLAQAPSYTAESIVNLASGAPGALAPNELAGIGGTGLSLVQKAITAADILAGELPVMLPGTGVRVLVGGLPAHIYLASPGQINFLVPSNLRTGETTVQVVRDSTAGPAIRITLREAAPAIFQVDQVSVVASHLDYSLVSEQAPAAPGEWVILWATGLGPVTPPAVYGMLPMTAASLQQMGAFQVLLDGAAVAPERIGYAGVAPGWAGLYQINLKLPQSVGQNPEIRFVAGDAISPPNLRLWVQP